MKCDGQIVKNASDRNVKFGFKYIKNTKITGTYLFRNNVDSIDCNMASDLQNAKYTIMIYNVDEQEWQ